MSLDRGTADARTTLAWQRTALALVAGSAVMARLTVDLGWYAVAMVSAAMLLSIWVFLESSVRYSRGAGVASRLRGGRAHASLALATLLLACSELVALVVAW
jgi:uncharacterized membrane protein YidH (DUF202 family)